MNYRVYTRTEKSKSLDHKVNEDSLMFSEYSFMEDKAIRLLVVADGMGGLEDGDKASRNAILGFLKTFYEKTMLLYMEADMDGVSMRYYAEQLEQVLIEAVKNANAEVCKNADFLKPTGTTLSAVCIVDNYAIIINVGDSPVYFYRAKSHELKLVSVLQTQAEQEAEAELYERYSAEYYANDHRLYCSLGQYSQLRTEDIRVASVGCLKNGDMFLLGSDGAFGRMQEYEILELIAPCDKEDEEFIITQLFELARMDKADDQTAILYVIDGEILV